MSDTQNDSQSRRAMRLHRIRILIVGGFGIFVIASMWIGMRASVGWTVAGTLGGAICIAVAVAELYLMREGAGPESRR